MTAPLCAMWQGRCARPAHLIVLALIEIQPRDYEPLRWYVCDTLRCIDAARVHAETWGVHVDTIRLTSADIEALTGQLAVA
jgi:hypothetical protein